MTDLQAAVGLVQLGRLPEVVARRRELAGVVRQGASPRSPGLRAVADPAWGTSNFQSFWVEVEADYPLDREGLLARAGRGRHLGPPRHHGRPPAARLRRVTGAGPLPVTERLTDHTLILPLFHQMSESEQARVIEVLRRRAAGDGPPDPGGGRAGWRARSSRCCVRVPAHDHESSWSTTTRSWPAPQVDGLAVVGAARATVDRHDAGSWSASAAERSRRRIVSPAAPSSAWPTDRYATVVHPRVGRARRLHASAAAPSCSPASC